MSGYDRKMKSSLESMYDWAVRNLPPRSQLSKGKQIEIAHRMNKIEQHGFSFFAGHYIYDDVKYISNVAEGK